MSEVNDGGSAFSCSKCGELFIPKDWQIKSRDYRCLPCKRAQQNATNAKQPALMRRRARERYAQNADYWRQYAEDRKNDPDYKMKRAARRKVATEIEAGRLRRAPCESCGSENADAHHDDYTRPLEIRWLCRRCHIKHEKEIAHAEAQ